jgi:hypothetical protein
MTNQKPKTHYRKVYKSDHLGVADLEDYIEQGMDLKLTIREVRQEFGVRVAGKKGDFNIVYFQEVGVKPWVLNSGNAKIISKFARSPLLEDWVGLYIQLYIDKNVKFGGEIVGGVRILPHQPKKSLPELTNANVDAWGRAIAVLKRDGNLNAVLKHMSISKKNMELLKKNMEQLNHDAQK